MIIYACKGLKHIVKLEKLREESAWLQVPAGSDDDPFHKSAFYNPTMGFNRSMGSLALGAALPYLGRKNVLDGFSGTGARGIRYALENEISEITFVDANPDAVKLLRKNAKLNKVKHARIVEKKFHTFAGECEDEYFDFVELDPFGSPSFFLEPASMLVGKGGLVSATATDLAKLCGREEATCLRNYASKPMKGSFCHELAIRILLKRIAEVFALRDLAVEPLLCFFEGHAIKAVVRCEKAPGKATETIRSFVYANYCRACLRRWMSQWPAEKCECGKKSDYAGPLWAGKLCDDEFVKKTIETNGKRNYEQKKQLDKTLQLILGENGLPPLFYDLHDFAALLKKPAPKTAEFIEGLRENGFAASATHFSPTGVRTDAKIEEVKKLFTKDSTRLAKVGDFFGKIKLKINTQKVLDEIDEEMDSKF